jgi:hypothetical protein
MYQIVYVFRKITVNSGNEVRNKSVTHLAARSLCTSSSDSRYFIPEAT